MTQTEALKLALAVLKSNDTWGSSIREAKEKAITAIKESLAQPEQEPVALNVTIEGEAAKLLSAMLEPALDGDDPTAIRLMIGNGYSGYGLYVADDEYPEEGSELLVNTTPPHPKHSEQHPVEFLANGTRFKMTFDSKGRVPTFWNYMQELDGRWVALVAAEDDCHLKLTAPQKTKEPEQEPVAHFGSAYVNENGVHITTVLGPVAIPQDAKLYTTQPQREPITDEIDRLRKALVYVAHSLHATPQYMLAKGITLLDGDAVRVSIDGCVVEASDKTIEAAHGIKE
jgi:hypothetical protein